MACIHLVGHESCRLIWYSLCLGTLAGVKLFMRAPGERMWFDYESGLEYAGRCTICSAKSKGVLFLEKQSLPTCHRGIFLSFDRRPVPNSPRPNPGQPLQRHYPWMPSKQKPTSHPLQPPRPRQ
ncbi:hypothetical protein VTH06DRAFT_5549 [Thermothelomyces fergusii]